MKPPQSEGARFGFLTPIIFALALLPAPVLCWADPYISYFSPPLASAGDMAYFDIKIHGSGFATNGLVVKFHNVLVHDAYVAASDLINAHFASNTPLGPCKITVTVNGKTATSATDFLVIGPGPVVTDFFPTSGQAGTQVTIQGVHFVSTYYPINNISFNGVNASTPSDLNDNQIIVTVPAGVTTGPIVVRSSLGAFSTITNTLSSSTNFFVPPTLTSFSPSSGRAGTNVTLTGKNFIGASAVSFGGVPASFSPPTNNTTLYATVPANAVSGTIQVTTPAGPPATKSGFLVPPTIYNFTPTNGSPGTTVTVNGANFNGTGFSVKFGNVTASSHSTPSFSQFTVTVPNGATNAPLTVGTTDGSHTSSQVFYLPPQITGFTPANAAPGTSIQLTGQNLLGATAVTFTGTSAVPVNGTNNTSLWVSVPAGVITGPITVATPGGTAGSGTQLFYGAPVINSFNPMAGLAGTNVSLLGTNFLGASAVKFNGVSAPTVSVINNGQINTTVPNGATTGPLAVVGPAGTAVSAGTFTLSASDLAVGVTAAPDPVFVGAELVYTITVTNNGAFAVPNVMLTNTLPASVNLKTSGTSQGTLDTNVNPILGTLGTINGGAIATVTLKVAPQSAGNITDTLSVGGNFPDPVSSNNSTSVSTTVSAGPLLSISGLTNRVQVFWPAALGNFTLQFKGALNETSNWSNVPTPPVLANGSNVVVEPRTNPSRYYRLKF
jgi:Domain of unknown function DUF11